VADSAVDPLAEDFNPDNLPAYPERYVYNNQERFLAAYQGCGNEAAAAHLVAMHPHTIELWKQNDVLGFTERLRWAFGYFCAQLESKALENALATKPGGNPLMLITLLNANLPAKYKPSTAFADETAAELMKKIRELSPRGTKTEDREKAIEDKGDKTVDEWIKSAPMSDEKGE